MRSVTSELQFDRIYWKMETPFGNHIQKPNAARVLSFVALTEFVKSKDESNPHTFFLLLYSIVYLTVNILDLL